jgi:hypothetical protein
MTLALSINSNNAATLSPANGMLASIDDFTVGCTDPYECTDNSEGTNIGNYYNSAQITATQFVAGAKVSFVKVVFELPTHRSGYV